MEDSKLFKMQLSFFSGLAGAIIAAAVTYWNAVDKSKSEAVLKNALAETKEQYLEQIKDSIRNIAIAEANAKNAAINSQQFVANLASLEERANSMVLELNATVKNSNLQTVELNQANMEVLRKKIVDDFAKIEMPAGAILSFDLSDCPSGWSEFEPAYGRFVRGIDKSGRIDPEGIRLPSTIQQDSFARHDHGGEYRYLNPKGVGGGGHANLMIEGGTGSRHFKLNSSGSSETRPKNVALLYCEKS